MRVNAYAGPVAVAAKHPPGYPYIKNGGGPPRSEVVMAHNHSKRSSFEDIHPRKGVFTRKARAAGESVHQYAEQEKHAGGTLGKEANLALTYERIARKRKRRK